MALKVTTCDHDLGRCFRWSTLCLQMLPSLTILTINDLGVFAFHVVTSVETSSIRNAQTLDFTTTIPDRNRTCI